MIRQLLRFRRALRSLHSIDRQLERIAECFEVYLLHVHGIAMREYKATPGGKEPELQYVDEDAMIIKEARIAAGLQKPDEEDE